jgi:hypothetical protein
VLFRSESNCVRWRQISERLRAAPLPPARPEPPHDREIVDQLANTIMLLCQKVYGSVAGTPVWFMDSLREIERLAMLRAAPLPPVEKEK